MPLGFSEVGSTPIGASASAAQDTAPAPAPVVTGVTVTPADAVLEGGATQQYEARVEGFDQTQAVEWSVTLGIVSAQGNITAPAAMAADQVGTVIATSVDDPTKSGSALFIVRGTATTENPDPTPGEEPVLSFTPSASRTVRILAGRQVYDTGPFWTVNGTLGPVGSKDPNSTIDIPFDWSAWLADIGNPALSAIDFLLSPGLVSAGAVPLRVDDKLVGAAVLVSEGAIGGGNNSGVHTITCRITTATVPARTEDRTVVLQIREQ